MPYIIRLVTLMTNKNKKADVMTVQGTTNSPKSFEDRFVGDYKINGVNRTINALEIPMFTQKTFDLLCEDFSKTAGVLNFFGKDTCSKKLSSHITQINQFETDITTAKQNLPKFTKEKEQLLVISWIIFAVLTPLLIPCVCANVSFALPATVIMVATLLSLLFCAAIAESMGDLLVRQAKENLRFQNELFEKECDRVKSCLTTQLPQAYIALELYGDSLLNDLDKKIKDQRPATINYSEMDTRVQKIHQYQTLRDDLAQMIEFFRQFKTSTQEAIPTAPANRSEDFVTVNGYPVLDPEEDAS